MKEIIANNIIFYRKSLKLTQAELAEKLNYSDKAVSKWERAETTPDVFILSQLAELFGITVNDLLVKKELDEIKIKNKKLKSLNEKRILISILSAGLAWLVATIVFVIIKITVPTFQYIWLAFIYAIPVSNIILMIFSLIWCEKKLVTTMVTSVFVWSTALSVFLSLRFFKNIWTVFLIAGVLQVLLIFWFYLNNRKKSTV